MKVKFVDLASHYLRFRTEILDKIDQLSSAGSYILGQEVETFEERFASECDSRYALAVANGTDAIFLVLKALGIGPGDEVITAVNSFIASAGAIVMTGARPELCDVGDDYNIDVAKLASCITPRTKAIVPVHLTGLPADMGPLMELAERHRLPVIEDAAQAISARYRKQKVGSFGIAGAFSLHPLKNLHVQGDGGMITTNNESLYRTLKQLRNHGLIDRDRVGFWGYNSRLDTLQAGIGNIKLNYHKECTERFQGIAKLYFEGLTGVVTTPLSYSDREGVYHNFVIRVKERQKLQDFLLEHGIETKIHYPIPIHLQECAKDLGYQHGDFPVAEQQASEILSLPIYPELNDEQVGYVIDMIRKYYLA